MTQSRRRLDPTTRLTSLDHGVILGMYPGADPTFGIELQRMNAGSAVWNTIYQVEDTIQQSEVVYTDYLPNDNRSRSYRARHIKVGWTAGAWTDTATAIPSELPNNEGSGGGGGGRPPVYMTGRGMPVDMWVNTGASIKAGNGITAATITKTIRFPACDFIARTSTFAWNLTAGYLEHDSAVSTELRQYRVPVVLPEGTILNSLAIRGYVGSTVAANNMICTLNRYSSEGVATNLGNITLGTTDAGAWVTVSSTYGETIQNPYTYDIQVTTRPNVSVARFLYTEAEYTASNYEQSY